jgi:hypothetical protein
MKTLFVIILILSTFVVSAQSKIINLDSIYRAPKTQAQLAENAITVPTVVIYKTIKYQAYQSANGKLFIIVQSPASKNWYRKYIKQD